LARGTRLREILKQPQNSPLSVAEQVALIYTGINGFLDNLDLNDVKKYCANLLLALANNKQYITEVEKAGEFTEKAEEALKEIIEGTTKNFVTSN